MDFLWKRSCKAFFTCDQHILSCVTQRSSFLQSNDDFAVNPDDDAKSYQVEIIEALLYSRKMTLNNGVISAIEKTLLRSPSFSPYLETMTKSFLAFTCL